MNFSNLFFRKNSWFCDWFLDLSTTETPAISPVSGYLLLCLNNYYICLKINGIMSVSEFLLGGLASFLASFVFIFTLLIFLRPKFEIVPFIAKNDSPFDSVNQICYSFKIINKSFFGAYDIEARANYYHLVQGENGIVNKVFSKIDLKTDKINFISGYNPFKRKYGDNCVQFFTYQDLSDKMKPTTHIRFQVTAKHSLTGLNNIFTYEFVNKGSIIDGKFKEGNYKEVIKC